MPELPEVETIARALRLGGLGREAVTNKIIERANLYWSRTLAMPTPEVFHLQISSQTICTVSRRGKFLILSLSKGALLFHMRMSGNLIVEDSHDPISSHHRLTLDLAGGTRLAFIDARKFGRVWLCADPNEVLSKLGPEPLDPEFTALDFHQRLQGHRRQIKPLIIDQTFLAGVGNIYADEALHLARIHPQSIASQLGYPQAECLLASLRQVLLTGIQNNGTSFDWAYRGGDFQNHLRVYQRTGQPCLECDTPIQRIRVGQRGTYFCSRCQVL